MSHTVMAEFHCNEGMGELLLPGLLESLSDTRAFEGCLSVETYVDQDDPDRVYLWEKWATRENYESYIAWRSETGMLEALAAVLVSPMLVPDETNSLPTKSAGNLTSTTNC